MYKNVLLMRNGCEGCSAKTCLGVLLAESMNAKVTAAYISGDFTWQELRKIYGLDELKWHGSARDGKKAKAAAESRKAGQANELLISMEKMCTDRGIPCELVHLTSRSPLHGVLKVAEEKRCDVIVTSTDLQSEMDRLSYVDLISTGGKVQIPMLIHHTM